MAGGLVVVDGSFLTAARLITNPDWISAALVIAAILNVPIFVSANVLLKRRSQVFAQFVDKEVAAKSADWVRV